MAKSMSCTSMILMSFLVVLTIIGAVQSVCIKSSLVHADDDGDQMRCSYLSSPNTNWISKDSKCTSCHCTGYKSFSCSKMKCLRSSHHGFGCKDNEYLETRYCCPYCENKDAPTPTKCPFYSSNTSLVPNTVLTKYGKCGHALVCHQDGILRPTYIPCFGFYSLWWCLMFAMSIITFMLTVHFIIRIIRRWRRHMMGDEEEFEISNAHIHDDSQHAPYYEDYKHVEPEYQTSEGTCEKPVDSNNEDPRVQIV